MSQQLLLVDEVAAKLRKKPAQLRWMIHAGKAPRHAKIGGRLVWRESDVDAYIEAAFEVVAVAA